MLHDVGSIAREAGGDSAPCYCFPDWQLSAVKPLVWVKSTGHRIEEFAAKLQAKIDTNCCQIRGS